MVYEHRPFGQRVEPDAEVVSALQAGVRKHGVAGLVKQLGREQDPDRKISWTPVMAAAWGFAILPEHLALIQTGIAALGLVGVEPIQVLAEAPPAPELRDPTTGDLARPLIGWPSR